MNVFVGEITGDIATLGAEEALHCTKVLRNKIGETVWVTNGRGKTIQGVITEIGKNRVVVRVEKKVNLASLTTPLHIAIAPTKNLDRFEFFIEKSIELGISEITPIITKNSERRHLRMDKMEKKAIAASKQSLRSQFVKLNPMVDFDTFIKNHNSDKIYMAHCNEVPARQLITAISTAERTTICIGPEGDFSNDEMTQFQTLRNSAFLSLGPNRLRTETAGILVASYFYLGIKDI